MGGRRPSGYLRRLWKRRRKREESKGGEGGKGTCREGWEYSGPGNSVNSVLMGEG